MAVMHYHVKFDADILSRPELLTFFFEIQDGGHRHLAFSGYVNLTILYSVLIMWYLCSVPNLIQIYVIVTEINALMLQTFI